MSLEEALAKARAIAAKLSGLRKYFIDINSMVQIEKYSCKAVASEVGTKRKSRWDTDDQNAFSGAGCMKYFPNL